MKKYVVAFKTPEAMTIDQAVIVGESEAQAALKYLENIGWDPLEWDGYHKNPSLEDVQSFAHDFGCDISALEI